MPCSGQNLPAAPFAKISARCFSLAHGAFFPFSFFLALGLIRSPRLVKETRHGKAGIGPSADLETLFPACVGNLRDS